MCRRRSFPSHRDAKVLTTPHPSLPSDTFAPAGRPPRFLIHPGCYFFALASPVRVGFSDGQEAIFGRADRVCIEAG